jgi:hypothetical protein
MNVAQNFNLCGGRPILAAQISCQAYGLRHLFKRREHGGTVDGNLRGADDRTEVSS